MAFSDSRLYMARSRDKGYAPIKVPKKGGHHVEGTLTIGPADMAKELIENTVPLLREAIKFSTWILYPLPRFLWGKCCGKATHMPGYDLNTYGPNTLAILDSARTLIKEQLHGEFTSIRVTNVAKALAGQDGRDLTHWGQDPIVPSNIGYRAILNKILNKIRSRQADRKRLGEVMVNPAAKKPHPLETRTRGGPPNRGRGGWRAKGPFRGRRPLYRGWY